MILAILRRSKVGLEQLLAPLLEVIVDGFGENAIRLNVDVIAELKSASETWSSELRSTVIQFTTLIEIDDIIPALTMQADNVTKAMESARSWAHE